MAELRIVAAAYREGLLIFTMPPPARHGDILLAVGRRMPPDDSGFLSSDGTFVGRAQAYQIAQRAGQLLPRKPDGYNGPDLYSEDVW